MKRLVTAAVALMVSGQAQANDFDIAHVRQQGVDMIIIPLNQEFGYKSQADQSRAAYALQLCASSARLAGDVALVWPTSSGGTGSLGPRNWSGFLRSIDMLWVAKNINKQLHCR